MELYLLVHPASELNQYPTYDLKKMSAIWRESIQKASEREEFGIIYLSGTTYYQEHSDSHDGKSYGHVSRHQYEIFDYFRSSFKENSKIVIANNLYFPGIHSDPRISHVSKVTARGIWTELCVNDSLDGICEEYGLSRDICSIAFDESVFKGKGYHRDGKKILKKLGISPEAYKRCDFGERMKLVFDPKNINDIRLDFQEYFSSQA